jgi:antitoxin CptB
MKDERLKRLIYQSAHRGTREMDLLLGAFAEKRLGSLSHNMICSYETLLNESDTNLFAWIVLKQMPPVHFQEILHKIISEK